MPISANLKTVFRSIILQPFDHMSISLVDPWVLNKISFLKMNVIVWTFWKLSTIIFFPHLSFSFTFPFFLPFPYFGPPNLNFLFFLPPLVWPCLCLYPVHLSIKMKSTKHYLALLYQYHIRIGTVSQTPQLQCLFCPWSSLKHL